MDSQAEHDMREAWENPPPTMRIPNCDFCPIEAVVDAKTKMGPWAYLCPDHQEEYAHPSFPPSVLKELDAYK